MQPTRSHLSRLMKIWRSAGWPSRDPIDIDLLAAGWVSRTGDHPVQECLRLTDAGIAVLAQGRQSQRRAESDHDRLALRMADLLMASGRLVWRELSLRAQVDAESTSTGGVEATSLPMSLWGDVGLATDDVPSGLDMAPPVGNSQRWRQTRPDLFSVRHTSKPAYLQPMVHEVKVSRADLLSDLRHAAKRNAYQWLCSECHYVFPHGVAEPQELPEALGVWMLHGDIDTGRLEMLRPAKHTPCTIPFDVWMAMAKASPVRRSLERAQAELTNVDEPDSLGVRTPHGHPE